MRLPAGVVVQGFAQLIQVRNTFTASNHFKNLPGVQPWPYQFIKEKKTIACKCNANILNSDSISTKLNLQWKIEGKRTLHAIYLHNRKIMVVNSTYLENSTMEVYSLMYQQI